MFYVRKAKDISIVNETLEVITERERVVLPLNTVDHILFKGRNMRDEVAKRNDIILLYTNEHREIYTIKFKDETVANQVYSVLSDIIKQKQNEET